MSEKTDFKKLYKNLYTPKNTSWELVEVVPQQFICVSGIGDPNTSSEYAESVQALYAVAYGLKFFSKNRLNKDYVVGPLEGLWYADDPKVFTDGQKDLWQWTMMILSPGWIDDKTVGQVKEQIFEKKKLEKILQIQTLQLNEGLSAQMLHVGSYDTEKAVLNELYTTFLPKNNLQMAGKHHEVYLSDPRKTAESKLKTVLRQPVTKK